MPRRPGRRRRAGGRLRVEALKRRRVMVDAPLKLPHEAVNTQGPGVDDRRPDAIQVHQLEAQLTVATRDVEDALAAPKRVLAEGLQQKAPQGAGLPALPHHAPPAAPGAPRLGVVRGGRRSVLRREAVREFARVAIEAAALPQKVPAHRLLRPRHLGRRQQPIVGRWGRRRRHRALHLAASLILLFVMLLFVLLLVLIFIRICINILGAVLDGRQRRTARALQAPSFADQPKASPNSPIAEGRHASSLQTRAIEMGSGG
mmetsp:Transcript_43629/g.117100  ORF Transcript_43629/g.117100 Transcript_43629/m.117100 type:complete len:259 (+) Transcript_43629:581-1357(+)